MENTVKRLLFWLVTLSIPILLVVSLEMFLRLTHVGPDLRLFIPLDEDKTRLINNPHVSLRYFPRPDQTGFGGDDTFKKVKDDSTFRIFVLGGSTTAGFPYFYNGRFSNQIRKRLENSISGLNFEVVNIGMTAVNSYTVRDFARECLRYEPDLLVIYAGHNEFYGALGSGSSHGSPFGTNRILTSAFLRLKRLKLYQLFGSSWQKLKKPPASKLDRQTLMARMVKNSAIPVNSDVYRNTLRVFTGNMSDIIYWTKKKQVPVLLGTLVSNLRDQKPFISIPSNKDHEDALIKKINEISRLLEEGKKESVPDLCKQIYDMDSTYAMVNFVLGKYHEQNGNYPEARHYYRKARDLDGLRFRASSDINSIIRSFAGKHDHVFLADIESDFEMKSPHQIVGNNLMLEHLHPNLEGYVLIGESFYTSIIRNRLTGRMINNLNMTDQAVNDEYYQTSTNLTDLDYQMVFYQLEKLKSDWPFKEIGNAVSLADFQPESYAQEVALDVLGKKYNYWEGHMRMITHYSDTGEDSLVIREANTLAEAFPHMWQSHRILADAMVEIHEYDQALISYKKVIEMQPDAFSYKWIGNIYLNREQAAKAIPYLERSLELDPGDPQAMYNLSGAYFLTGDRDGAIAQLDQLIDEKPDFPGARSFYEKILRLQ